MVHQAAAKGFARGAVEYERGRPSYPDAAVEQIIREYSIGLGTSVVDLGAGTGKFTRLLAPTGATILAVEPVAEMREIFASVLPDIDVVDGTAESIPVADRSTDVVTAAQALHWADAEKAIPEIHRVLRSGGGVAFVWNSRANSGWEARITKLMDRVAGAAPRYGTARDGGWQRVLEEHAGFGGLRREEFALEHPTTVDATLARVASTSYVSALSDDDRTNVLDEVRQILAEARLGTEFVEAYITEVFLCRKR
jgi:SAM-dependent methyltransferase